jgi:hypothetical protein
MKITIYGCSTRTPNRGPHLHLSALKSLAKQDDSEDLGGTPMAKGTRAEPLVTASRNVLQ